MEVKDRPYFAILKSLIECNTISKNSNLELIHFVEALLLPYHFKINLYYNEDKTKANLIAAIGPEVGGGLMLAGHTDVVPVQGQDWKFSPFKLTTNGNRFIGRGVSDMKGFLALVCDVLTSSDLSKLTKPIYFVLTYDEEVGCFGAKNIKDELGKIAKYVDFALIGEPTNFNLVDAHKGLQCTRSQLSGRPAHSSCPHLGSNAIVAATDLIQNIPSVIPTDENRRFIPPYTTYNIGTIEGGNALNIIAEHCQIDWEFRPLPTVDAKQINASINELSEQIAKARDVSIEHHIIATVPGLTNNMNGQAIQYLKEFCSDDVEVTTAAFVTEAGIFQEANIPSVVFGPGELEQAHQPNESISIQSMDRYREFLTNLINRSNLCL